MKARILIAVAVLALAGALVFAARPHETTADERVDQITTELDPVLLGLAGAQPDGNQLSAAVFGDTPGADHTLLGAGGPDRQPDRVQEQHDQLNVVERAALERLEALPQL